jgi:agmatine deiminase
MPNAFLQFNYIPYPLWRRRMPLNNALRPLYSRYLAADADFNPPLKPEAMAAYLTRWGLLNGLGEADARDHLRSQPASVERTRDDIEPQAAPATPVRLPAQWEPLQSVLLTWPALYPPLWEQHAQMVEAITPVAEVVINVPAAAWAGAAELYLKTRGRANLERVRFLLLPTDDIWVRDYGPIVGLDADGKPVCVKAIFDPLPSYPQARDNAMATRWAAHEGIPARRLDLHLEGGNIWSDGRGTLLISSQVYHANRRLTYPRLIEKLERVFDVRKVIITPKLQREETGHVDLVCKLADERTVLVSAPTVAYNTDALQATADLFRQQTNAAGERYRVFELPSPPLYLNWLVYPVWRSYTNALTVNSRVLVPVFGIPEDEQALSIYSEAMPDHAVIPIMCAVGANGGGAVHCLTKEVPASTPTRLI